MSPIAVPGTDQRGPGDGQLDLDVEGLGFPRHCFSSASFAERGDTSASQLLPRMTTSDEMGTFCHDHIQHPLMWCDDKKRLVERKNAEESLRMWRRRKAEESARKEKDKQEVNT